MAKRKHVAKAARAKQGVTCFVIMPFGQPFDRYYSNILAPAAVDAGLEPIRTDSLFRSSNIVADIWRLTKESAVLLADLTGRNPNVFYELGLAHALGKPVVLIASNVDDVPFELRALRVLIYDREDEAWGAKLQQGVASALRETLADVPGAVPSPFLEASRPSRPTEAPVELELRRLWDELRAIQSQVAGTASAPPTFFLPRPSPDAVALVRATRQWAARSRRRHVVAWATDDMLASVLTLLLLAGEFIESIKLVRAVTNRGLKEAKDTVDPIRYWLRRTGRIAA
jgi:hypothetical protein